MQVPGTVEGESTRARVLNTALALIAERGYAATSIREVAERMGFTKAALYYHFASKDALLQALAAPVLDGLQRLAAEPVSASATARRGCVAEYVDLVVSAADVMRVLYDDPSARNSALLAQVRPLYGQVFARLCGAEQPSTLDTALARAAVGAVHAALLRADADDDPSILRAAATTAACGALGLARFTGSQSNDPLKTRSRRGSP
jgi:AcrR family transcriptional regulator